MPKTVYILGAGFSKGMGAPLQSHIIKLIFDLDILQIDWDYRAIFEECRERFRSFLINTLSILPDYHHILNLEDIYTPIDRCISDNISFRNLQRADLLELRQKINALIVMLFKHRLKGNYLPNYAHKFASFLVSERKRNIDGDPFSILSLNWDIIIDNYLNAAINSTEGVVELIAAFK